MSDPTPERLCQKDSFTFYLPHVVKFTIFCIIINETFICLFIYLFMAVSGLHFCAWAFSSCGEWGLLFVAVRGLLNAMASLVAEHGL